MEGIIKPQISIIMPCYNSEKYVQESIKSVYENTVANKCELIIINDGSTDSTESIILSTIKGRTCPSIKYKKITNSGVSIARNTGIDIADGDYILFIDSDDKQSPKMIEALIKGIESFDADIVFCQWTNKEESLEMSLVDSKKVDLISLLYDLLYRTKPIGLWSVIFRKSLLDKNKIRFSPDKKYGEDLEFLWLAVLNATTVVETDAKYYYYRTSTTSAMKKATWRKTEILDVMKNVGNEVKKHMPFFYDEFERFMLPRTLLSLLKDFAQADSKEYFDKLGQDYDCKTAMREIDKGGAMIRASAALYQFSPQLFYSVFKRLA